MAVQLKIEFHIMPLNNREIKTIEFTDGFIKQLITLSTALFALPTIFSRDFIIKLTCLEKGLLLTSWIFYFVSIILGLFAITKLITLVSPEYGIKNIRIRKGMFRNIALAQGLVFIFGLIFTFILGIKIIF